MYPCAGSCGSPYGSKRESRITFFQSYRRETCKGTKAKPASAIIGHFLLALGNNALPIHRLQLAIVLAVALVFSVFGCEFLFDSRGALIAVGVAWLLLTIVNLVWLLYLTSEEESPFYRFLYAGSPPQGGGGRRTRTHSHSDVYGSGNGIGSGIGNDVGGGNGRAYGASPAFSGYAPTGTGLDTTPQKLRDESLASQRQPQVQPMSMSQSPSNLQQQQQQQTAHLRAKAMYAYSADPSDSNEVSFAKGDILEVLDNTGKWWQVRTPSGAVGIAPSNYCSLIDAA